MKYKLINKTTDEEHLCDKVTIDGFDYYVIDKTVKKEDGWCWDDKYKKLVNPEQNLKTPTHDADFYWKIIATNNPNIDIPKVVDKVEQLAHKYFAEERFNWEQENPNGLKSPQSLVEHYNKTFTPLFKAGYNKSQETHPFSVEDMIEFAVFYQKHQGRSLEYWGKNLFKIWKEQQPKIVYYGN